MRWMRSPFYCSLFFFSSVIVRRRKLVKETAEASEFALTLLELVEEDGLVVDQGMVEC